MGPPGEPRTSRLQSRPQSLHSEHERQSEQAGRSSTNLHAQVLAASLRSQRAPVLQGTTSIPQSSRSSGDVTADKSPSVALHPTISRNSDGSSRDGSDGSALHARRQREANAAGIALSQGLPPPPPLPATRPMRMRRVSSSSSLSKPKTPLSVRDLGRDFDRYYNPFATPNESTADLPLLGNDSISRPRTAVSGSNDPAASEAELRRLSDPFSDERVLADTPRADEISFPFIPMRSSRNRLVDENDPEKFFFTYLDDRLGAPNAENQGYNFPLYWHEKEWDDDMHLPMVDDDIKLKLKFRDHFTRENLASTIGLCFMILGLLCIFIVLPVLGFSGFDLLGNNDTPLDQMWGYDGHEITWATVNASRTWPLLKNMRTGLIDPDTPKSAMTRAGIDGTQYKLVFSDEFNEPNRTFYAGDDPYWTAPDIWYGATMDLEWYDPDAATTWDGALELRLDAFENHGLQFRSGMLNSWNQLCFKGGIFEVSVSLPGPAGVHGLWPGVWSLGNLGRPGYLASTDGTWPFSYDDCDPGITPNQSDWSGMSKLPGQRFANCVCPGEDHPTPGKGRGAPEIDIIEVSADYGGLNLAVATQSYQIAPFDIWWYPNYDFMELPNYDFSFVNTWTGGPFQQAVSTTTMLNNSWYDGEAYQKYAYEYKPGSTEDAYIAWTVSDEMMMKFDGRALGPNGNVGQRIISEEPMSMILNLGISENWVDIQWAKLHFPTIMRIDYVRIYQKPGEESVTCDPPGWETTQFIADHPEAYNNPNYTRWTDIPGYTWPKNSLMHGCD